VADTKQIDQLEKSGQISAKTAQELRNRIVVEDAAQTLDIAQNIAQIEAEEAAIQEGAAAADAVADVLPQEGALMESAITDGATSISPAPGLQPRDAASVTSDAMQAAQMQQAQPQMQMPEPSPIASQVQPTAVETLTPEDFIAPDEETQEQVNQALMAEVEDQDSGFFRRIQAQRDAVEGAEAQAEAEAALLAQRTKTMEDAEDREFNQQQLERQRIFQAEEKLNELRTAAEKAVGEVDPERFVKNLSLGGKLMAFIGIALGGLGGGPNQALATFQRRVDADIAKQEAEATTAKEAVEGQENLIQRLRGTFKDDRMARTANRLLVTERFQNQLREVAARHKSPQILARAEDMIGKLEIEKQKHEAELKLLAAKAAPSTGFRVGRGFAPQDKDESKRSIAGVGLANSEDDAKNIRQKMRDGKDAEKALDELLRISKKPFGELEPKTRSRVNTLRALLRGKLRLALIGPGQVSELEQKILDNAIGNINKFIKFPGTQKEKLIILKDQLNSSIENALEQGGLGTTTKFTPEE